MPLPATVQVKLSSEAGDGMIELTAVIASEMALRELVELMLGVTGKDPKRVHELLLRGTLVSGGSRLRWVGWDAATPELETLLRTYPEPEPSRPFSFERTTHVVLRGAAGRVGITREAGSAPRFLQRKTFWAALMEAAAVAPPQYVEYSYGQRADCYRMELNATAAAALRESASRLKYSALEAQVRRAALEAVDFYVARAD